MDPPTPMIDKVVNNLLKVEDCSVVGIRADGGRKGKIHDLPPGVPVMITEPFCSVVPDDKNETSWATSNMRSPTDSFCLVSPLIVVRRRSLLVSPTRSDRTKHGPNGAKVSNPLENPHCGTTPAYVGSFCHFREEMSFPHM